MKKRLNQTHRNIVEDWNYKKNKSLKPEQFTYTSKVKVWWICKRKHEYQVSIHSRVRSNGCRICQRATHVENARKARLKNSQTFSEKFPELLKEWNYEKNFPLTPDKISFSSHKKVWWKCEKGHEWQSIAKNRGRGDGCPNPECSIKKQVSSFRKNRINRTGKTLASEYPELIKEWDYKKNDLQPEELSPYSKYRAAWKCQFGHTWDAVVDNRTTNQSNCPECNPQSSRLEIYLLCEIRSIIKNTKWRYKIDKSECDIYIEELGIGIEVDGAYWHQSKLNQDRKKNKVFKKNNIKLLRVREKKLPKIEGDIITYNSIDKHQNISNKVIKYLAKSDKRFRKYSFSQQAKNEYKQMISRLPAPPKGKTLVDTDPEVASEWDFEKNYPLTPNQFSRGSDQKFWWRCNKGHPSYEAVIKNKTLRGSGCMKCYLERIKNNN